MKIKTLLLLLAVCILPGSLCAGVVFSPDTLGTGKLYRDSTYRRVIKEGSQSGLLFLLSARGLADTERLRRQCP